MKEIYPGVFEVSERFARSLVPNGKLPAHGREALVEYDRNYWMKRGRLDGNKQIWELRATEWELINGQAVLRHNPEQALLRFQEVRKSMLRGVL